MIRRRGGLMIFLLGRTWESWSVDQQEVDATWFCWCLDVTPGHLPR